MDSKPVLGTSSSEALVEGEVVSVGRKDRQKHGKDVHVSSPNERSAFFSFFTLFDGFFERESFDSLCFPELGSVATNLSSSSWLVALRLPDLNFAVDEDEKESPCDGLDLDLEFESAISSSL